MTKHKDKEELSVRGENMSENRLEIIGFHLADEPYGCFSNWYMADFELAGIKYCCVEQYMMKRKVAPCRKI